MDKKILGIFVLAALLSACSASGEENSARTSEAEEPAYYIDADDMDGIIDISRYVLSCEGQEARVSSALLVNEMGFIPGKETNGTGNNATGSEPETNFAVFESPDGRLLQLEVGGSQVVFGGSAYTMPSVNEASDDGMVVFSLTDVAFAIGYEEIYVKREGENISFLLKREFAGEDKEEE